MYPWISRTHDFWLQFCEKSAAYTWTFTVIDDIGRPKKDQSLFESSLVLQFKRQFEREHTQHDCFYSS